MHHRDDPAPVSEVTCKAAAALAASATGLVQDGTATEGQRAEAARLLRAAADMLVTPQPKPSCRCGVNRGIVFTQTAAGSERTAAAVAQKQRELLEPLGSFG